MHPHQSHLFKRDDDARQYILRVVNGRPVEYRFDFHLFSGKAAIAMAQLTEVANVDRAALNGIATYANAMDNMADAFHGAPIWKRVWWALTNRLPFVKG